MKAYPGKADDLHFAGLSPQQEEKAITLIGCFTIAHKALESACNYVIAHAEDGESVGRGEAMTHALSELNEDETLAMWAILKRVYHDDLATNRVVTETMAFKGRLIEAAMLPDDSDEQIAAIVETIQAICELDPAEGDKASRLLAAMAGDLQWRDDGKEGEPPYFREYLATLDEDERAALVARMKAAGSKVVEGYP